MANVFDKVAGFIGKGTDTIDQVASGNLSQVTGQFNWTKFFLYVKLIMYFALILGLIVAIYHFFFKYNKKVLIRKLMGNSVIDTYFDRARVKKDERGKEKLVLLKTRKTCPVPTYPYTTKMGKNDFFELYLGDDGELYPWNNTNLIQAVGDLKERKNLVDPQVMKSWRLDEIKLTEQRFKKESFFEKYRDEIFLFITAMAIVGMIWLTMKSWEKSALAHASAFQAIATSCIG